MRFPPQILDEIRARLPVSEVVGRRVKLKKQGREWAGLSPFNAEKSPSFFVNDQKGFYHDFSSGKHGDIFKFVQETEGLSFPEAVEQLASLAGVDLPKATPEMAQAAERRKDLYDATEAACLYYEGRLQTSQGEAARAYLDFLYTDEAQALAAKHFYRPRNDAIAEQATVPLPPLPMVTIDADFGGWAKAQATHFNDGGTFDQAQNPKH